MVGEGNLLAELFRLNDELVQVLDRGTKGRQLSLDTDHKRLMSFFHAKGYKTHQAIVLLARNGFGEDAGILTRSLINLSIAARWINHDPNKWVPAYLDYEHVFQARLNRKIVQDPRLVGRSPQDAMIDYKDKQPMLDAAAKDATSRHGYNYRGWSGKSLYEMANELGMRSDYYFGYVLLSELEHTSIGALAEYVSLTPDGSFHVTGGPSLNWVRESLGAAHLFLIAIAKSVDQVLELGITTELEKLDARMLGLHGATRLSTPSQ